MSSTKVSSATTKKAPAAKSTVSKKSSGEKPTEKVASTSASASTSGSKQPSEKKAAPRKKAAKEEPAVEPEENANETSGNEDESGGDENDSKNITVEKYINLMLARKRDETKLLREEMQLLRDLKTAYNRQMRDMKKTKKIRQASKGGAPKNPSGFAQSARIRDALCDFLSMDHGSSIARTDVTRKVIRYIKDNQLEEKENRRNIEPDDALEKLVGGADERLKTMEARKAELEAIANKSPNDKKKREKADKCVVTDKLSYFNLQVHLNKHFIKEDKKKANASVQDSSTEQITATA